MLTGKAVIITGAGGALGRAAIAAVERAGGRTILFDRAFSSDDADRPSFEIDLTDLAAVTAVVDRVGDFDAVFNIAGGFAMGAKSYDASDDWQKMMALNADTVRHMMIAALPKLIAKGGGAIVNIGAYVARDGAADKSAYAASKAVVMSLTQSTAEEVRGQGVRVNAVLPTVLNTRANREAMPDADPADWVDIDRLAGVMVFLASDVARDIHGALIPVRGRA